MDTDLKRLIRLTGDELRRRKQEQISADASDHIALLRQHGASIGANQNAIDLYAELAEPALRGGIVVLLDRPSVSEEKYYSEGLEALIQSSPTLSEVGRLIRNSSDDEQGIQAVTVLDTFPMQPHPGRSLAEKQKSSQLLQAILVAKMPELIICCYQSEWDDGDVDFIRRTEHSGIGHPSNERVHMLELMPGMKCMMIDAFHPSFSVNYNPQWKTYKRLLELQFAKAFGTYHEVWQEEDWMRELRSNAYRLVRASGNVKIAIEALLTSVSNLHVSSNNESNAGPSAAQDTAQSILPAERPRFRRKVVRKSAHTVVEASSESLLAT